MIRVVVRHAAQAAEARVTRLELTSRDVVADGMSLGDTGPYEKLPGTVYFEVDPTIPGTRWCSTSAFTDSDLCDVLK